MRKLKFVVLLAALMTVGVGKSYAHDIEVANADGVTIYYNFTNDQTELAVTYEGSIYWSAVYGGKVVIPESVAYDGKTYSVTSIGEDAFRNCSDLTAVVIPGSVTSIDLDAFCNCSGLTEVAIPNSVTFIGESAFHYCSSLTEVTIPNGVPSIGWGTFYGCTGLTEVTIPNSVTSIGERAFSDCSSLTKLTIPNSVTTIGNYTFYNCSSLTELTIGNSVTTIGNYTFSYCSSLTELTIPNSVTSIGERAFTACRGLTELTIPNSVTFIGIGAFSACSGLTAVTIGNSVKSIGDNTFFECRGLTEVTIGNSVASIGNKAFYYCNSLTTLYSLNITPPSVANTDAFYSYYSNLYETVDVFVPAEALEAYQTAEVWKDFQKLQGIEGLGGETEKCATPTIHYANNKLTFKCETEGVTYESTITDTDIASYSNEEIDLSVTYTVTVYATKEGYEDSDVAIATLCWIDVEPKTEGTTDDNTSVQQISATPVLIQSSNGQITVTGLTDGIAVTVYTLSGQQVGTATSMGGLATVSTSLTTGTAAIVKMGDNKSVKIAVK